MCEKQAVNLDIGLYNNIPFIFKFFHDQLYTQTFIKDWASATANIQSKISLVPSRKNRRNNPSGNIVHYSWY